jgi:hypothetical protein
MILSILIPVTPAHEANFNQLHAHLIKQINGRAVEILYHISPAQINGGPSTGSKRQGLLEKAIGEYISCVDADDWVYDWYIDEMLTACASGADCFAINGIITTDGQHETKWRISKDYQNVDIVENGRPMLLRRTNHITGVKRLIALRAGFPDKSNAEDKHYSDRLVLHSEYKIERPMYHYKFSTHNKQYK